ncbi:hypothetical protein [Ichthyenterobacterium magnum]|uniref:O-antigen ligase-like membrane protein n=1 Tax=Ichthyenterobacterium magnum TaxID=1230530 RepID=A0A420DX69_9FLAO|nr:hypothetical protein [Ichthyenterobacterium magnum]RKE98840.1 hypothetical protein BXY80_0935 [Ichthyenterobacterium magnum]
MLNTKSLFSKSHYIIIWFVILSLCFDFIDKIEIFYRIDFVKFNRYLKLGFILYALLFIITHLKIVLKNTKLVIFSLLALIILFVLKFNFSDRYLYEFIRYVFMLIVFPLLYYVYNNKTHNLLTSLYLIFRGFIIANALAILISLMFDVAVFNSYRGSRFGYNGFILSQGITPYVYLAATVLFWKIKDRAMLIITIITSLLSGIKGVYFAEFLVIVLLLIFNKELNKTTKIKGMLMSILAFILSITLLFKLPNFEKAYKVKGFISTLFSQRTDNAIDIINSITVENYNVLIGVTKLSKVRLELQIADLLLFFGVLGLLVYILFIWFLNKNLVNNVASKAFFITCLSTSALSGNLLYIPFASILMLLVLLALNKQSQIK